MMMAPTAGFVFPKASKRKPEDLKTALPLKKKVKEKIYSTGLHPSSLHRQPNVHFQPKPSIIKP
jgi:Tat protein secretion system quality control protein TatD with DNase activity